jgi:hypothetical protein
MSSPRTRSVSCRAHAAPGTPSPDPISEALMPRGGGRLPLNGRLVFPGVTVPVVRCRCRRPGSCSRVRTVPFPSGAVPFRARLRLRLVGIISICHVNNSCFAFLPYFHTRKQHFAARAAGVSVNAGAHALIMEGDRIGRIACCAPWVSAAWARCTSPSVRCEFDQQVAIKRSSAARSP